MKKNIASDETILKTLGARIARERLNRNRTQAQLAREAGVSRPTVQRMEQGDSVQLVSFLRVLRVLDLLGNIDSLIPEPPVSPLEQLKMRGKERRRASSVREPENRKPWVWGDET